MTLIATESVYDIGRLTRKLESEIKHFKAIKKPTIGFVMSVASTAIFPYGFFAFESSLPSVLPATPREAVYTIVSLSMLAYLGLISYIVSSELIELYTAQKRHDVFTRLYDFIAMEHPPR